MKRKLKYGLLIVFLIICSSFIVSWCFMGVCFEHQGGFEESLTHGIFKNIFPDVNSSSVSIDNGDRGWGIPNIFWFFLLDKPPYSILIEIDDKTEKMRRMVVHRVVVDYGNNDIDTFDLEWSDGFNFSKKSEWVGDAKSIEYPIVTLGTSIPMLVEKNKSCSIVIEGYFEDVDNNKISFKTNNYFEYKPTSWKLYTGLGAYK